MKFQLPASLRGKGGRFAGDLGFKALTEVCNAVFGLLTFALLSRMLSSKAEYAVINQTIAISSLISPILLIKMNNAFCVFLAGEQDRARIKSRFFSVLCTCLPVCVVLCGLMVGGDSALSLLMFDSAEYAPLLGLMALYFIVLSLSTLCQSLYQATGQQKKSNVFIILRSVLTAVAFVVLSAIPHLATLENALLMYLATESVVFAAAMLCIVADYRQVPLRLEFAPLKEYYRYALPLMPSVILSWVNSFIGRFILNHLKDLDSAGTYGFYASLVSRAFFVNAVLVYTVFPYVAKFWNENNRGEVTNYLRRALHIGIGFGLPATAGLVITVPTITRLMSENTFEYAPTVMLWLCLASVFQMLYMNYSYLIDLSRRTEVYNVVFFLSSAVNVALNFWLIPKMGMEGAAVAMMMAYLVQLLVTVWVGTRSTGIRVVPEGWQVTKALIATATMTAVCHWIYADSITRFVLTIVVGVAVYAGVWTLITKLTKTSWL